VLMEPSPEFAIHSWPLPSVAIPWGAENVSGPRNGTVPHPSVSKSQTLFRLGDVLIASSPVAASARRPDVQAFCCFHQKLLVEEGSIADFFYQLTASAVVIHDRIE
jgi:hypothetical protein